MTTWFGSERISKLVGAAAIALAGALTIGCGPAPGYEPEPRMPAGFAPSAQEPLSSEELQARYEAEQRAQGDIAIGASQADEYGDTDPSALTEFKPALDGHGQWIEDSTYGTVWQPNESEVGTDFVPYVSAGSWTYDDTYGYTWVSTYDWGWAPFHYGRWVHLGHRGWVWIPGRTYAGAWVTWRYGGPTYGYVGWAPLGPDWYWYRGVAVGWTFGWSPYYVYCAHDRLYDHGVYQHVVQGPPARVHDANTREYALANPQVGGGSGGDRVLASPQVGGRTAANPRVVGPRPNEIGVPPERVPSPPKGNAGLARAHALSSPHTAIAQGAAPPIQRRALNGSLRRDDVVMGQPSRGPVTSTSPALSRLDPVARAPQVQGVSPVPPQRAALPELRPVPRQLQPAPGYSSVAPSATPHSSFGPSPSVVSRPPMTSSPSVSSPPPSAFRSPPSSSFSTSSPTFRSSPSVSSAPTFRSSPSVSSSPSFRSSSPSVSSSPSFRSSSPSVRSSPSVGSSPSFRSSPSVRRR
ncbi:MAG: hypothetical protein JST00_17025 [Deltaproteobacteria bacterium]|nr:hypothetical protein [Deltaproteobacteria bacterium]